MAMVSAVQEAQKDNLRSFNDYMMKVLEVSVILSFIVQFFFFFAFHSFCIMYYIF